MDIGALKKADAEAAEGVWVGDLPDMGDVRLRVRPMTHPRVMRAMGRARRAAAADIPEGQAGLSDAQEEQIDRDVMASVALVGWENLTSDGEPVPFSAELAAEFMRVETFEAAVRIAMSRALQDKLLARKALVKN